MRPIVTLLTDFGTADGYVAEIKGMLYTLVPDARVVDVTHDIPPQDVDMARLTLARYWRRFPPGTVHLVVVDPEVGSTRAALAVASDHRFLVGPDNGVLSPALVAAGANVVALPVAPHASPTFHGRDVFAPAAAALAAGTAIDALGTAITDPVVRRTREPLRHADGTITGEVIAVDRFGNLITNLMAVRGGVVEIAGRQIPVRRTYAEVPNGELLAVGGSTGLIEIALRNGSAARALAAGRGDAVRQHPR
jgi:S-adenosylmethionine hydrolase